MNKLTNYQSDLVDQAEEIIDTLSTKNHLKYQVRTYIDRLCATGEGKEVLKHFITVYKSHTRKYMRNKYIQRLYYFQDIILDANKIEYEYYSRHNRHNEWIKVERIRNNK